MGLNQAIQCQKCGHSNPYGSSRCVICDGAISSENDLTRTNMGETKDWSRLGSGSGDGAEQVFAPGTTVAGRYEILSLLGQGGMGAVYRARDMELDRLVALKVIRSELASDPRTLQRFKQELIVARQITHRNVIRIFDLGTHDSVKFITMELVEGRDLSAMMDERRFGPEEAARIVRQVCRALEAAHAENVIHRDLKPQNIMMESGGRVLVMDFGLARSVEGSGLTRTGAVLGTPAYMSPEQAKGVPLDARSDLFSLGIILYELLTGVTPFRADTVWAMLLKRTQEPAEPAIGVAPEIPQELSDIAAKCLAIDPGERYQDASELALALDMWLQDTPLSEPTLHAPRPRPVVPPERSRVLDPTVALPAAPPVQVAAPGSRKRRWIVPAAAAVVLLGAGVFAWQQFNSRPKAPLKTATVVVSDFNNHTGDAVFDGALEPMLRMALEGAGFISAYSRSSLPVKLDAPGKLDEATALRVAVGQGLGVVVSGALDRQGSGYALSAKVIRSVTGETIATVEAGASNKNQILYAVTKLASGIRKALGDDTSESAQRFATETLTATSLEAVHEYAAAMESLSSGNFAQARGRFSKAVDLDPKFGLAYAGMASASRSLGQNQDADKYIKLAIANIDGMTERERYRTRALYYVLAGDQQKCVEEYSALLTRYSSDVGSHNNLGVCYSYLRNVPKAIEEMNRAVEVLPKRPIYRFNLALYRAYAGNFPEAEKEVGSALAMNPSYAKGYLTLAYAKLGEGKLAEAAGAYQKLRSLNATGASLAAAGLADLAVYQGRFEEAIGILEAGARDDLAADRSDAAADKLVALAQAQAQRGRNAAAIAALNQALSSSGAVKIRFLAARTFLSVGESGRAEKLAASLATELRPEPRSYGKLIEAGLALNERNASQAVQLATEAKSLFDTWISRFDLGRMYLEAGAFTEADSEFDRCMKRRGEAMEVFMDDVPTYGYYPAVLYYEGRVHEGMKSSGFAEFYQTYLGLREKAGEDPLIPEVRRRMKP